MEIINTILIVIGFVSLGWYIKILKAEIKTQKGAIDTQSKILNNAKVFMDMYDINKLKDFVAIREETIELQKNKEIREIKDEIDIKDKTLKVIKEWSDDLLDLSVNLVFSTPSTISMVAINKMPDSPLKERFRKVSANIEKDEKTPRGLGVGIRAAHQIILSEEKLATGQTPSEDTIKK